MADFLNDYSNINVAADAVGGFLKGMQAGEDQKMRRLEFDAKMKAQDSETERRKFQDALEMRKAGVQKGADGSLQEMPGYKHRENIISLAPSGQKPVYGENGELVGTEYKPEYLQVQREKAYADPFGAKRLNAENAAKPRDAELTTAGYARRMEQAEQMFGRLMASKKFDPASTSSQVQAMYPPIFEGAKTPEQKSYEQIVRNFGSAVLRKESGAAISPTEYADVAKMYFPQPGDTKEQLLQKEQSRLQAFENFKTQSGKAYDMTPAVGLIPKGLVKKPGLIQAGPQAQAPAQNAGPKVGMVEDGHEFLGGDPADPKSWKKVK